MRVLLTRPRTDSETTAAELSRHGHTAVISPMLKIDFSGAEPTLEGAGAIAVTSANAIQAVAKVDAARAVPVFAVGGRTAEAARRAGFRLAGVASGSVESLAEEIAASWKPERGEILHLCGRDVRGDLVGALQARGLGARSEIVYEAHPVDELSSEARTALRLREIDAVLFFSPRTARHFTALVEREGMRPSLTPVSAVCLSAAVADSLTQSDWNQIVVALHTEISAMIDALDGLRRETD